MSQNLIAIRCYLFGHLVNLGMPQHRCLGPIGHQQNKFYLLEGNLRDFEERQNGPWLSLFKFSHMLWTFFCKSEKYHCYYHCHLDSMWGSKGRSSRKPQVSINSQSWDIPLRLLLQPLGIISGFLGKSSLKTSGLHQVLNLRNTTTNTIPGLYQVPKPRKLILIFCLKIFLFETLF